MAKSNNEFYTNLRDNSAAISMDFEAGRDVLLLAFGGIDGRLGISMYEFHNITVNINTINKIYLRDAYKFWYHKGLPETGRNIDELACYLKSFTDHASTKKVVVFGNSGGGYAALLFGHLLKATEVHAFSPKTFLNPLRRLIHNDLPPRGNILNMLRLLRHGQHKYFDIDHLFSTEKTQNTQFNIYYPANKLDQIHAVRLSKYPFVNLHSYDYSEHDLVKHLKETGALKEILARALAKPI